MVVGTKCPVIEGLEFLKGDSIQVPVPGKPGIIEFWATWCGPCRQVFPHLTDIARKNKAKGLFCVGITNERKSPQLAAFVQQQSYGMDYTVAVDVDSEGQEKLIMPAGARGIPHAFVVDKDGTIVYSGHPMQPDFEKAVNNVVSEAAPKQEALPLITATAEELAAMPVRELKAILSDRGISFIGLAEKQEFVERIRELCTSTTYYSKV
mmetsp:Transcript_21619/g.67982  ORF Transcript_21619/g.67982 Transcript_21619/m.67982 type:complete len:208 (-) Transcript_21619:27-650(-)